MGGSLRTVLGLLCVAALISLPTLQMGNPGQNTALVAIAPDQGAPEYALTLQRAAAGRDVGGPRPAAPAASSDAESTAAPTSTPEALGTGGPDNGLWLWPTPSKLITSGFGYRSDPFTGGSAFHSGVDFSDACGTRVGATRPGTVTFAGVAGGYGNRVVVDHGGGVLSSYSHLQTITVAVGTAVNQSHVLGLVGTTGRSTGCHLHFEIMVNGGFSDPMPYLTGNPAANPTTFGNADIASAPTETPTSQSPASPSPSPTDDPCSLSDDGQEVVDTGGMIPVSPTPSPTTSRAPCPTASTSQPPSTPASSSSESSTPPAAEQTSPQPTDSPQSPAESTSAQSPAESTSAEPTDSPASRADSSTSLPIPEAPSTSQTTTEPVHSPAPQSSSTADESSSVVTPSSATSTEATAAAPSEVDSSSNSPA